MDDVGTDGVEIKAFKDIKGAMKLALLETSPIRSGSVFECTMEVFNLVS